MNTHSHTAFLEISDLSLAASLLTMGYQPVQEQPFAKFSTPDGRTKYKFFLQPGNGLQELIQAWNTDGWESQPENGEKPFAYIKAFYKNRMGLLDVVKQSAEMITINQNGKTAVISKTASEELKTQVFNRL